MSFIALLSPAKRLEFSGPKPAFDLSEPKFSKQSRELIRVARGWSAQDIAARMKLSDDLAKLNFDRYQGFKMRGDGGERQAALFAFMGDVYQGLDAASLSDEQVLCAQSQIRILSGLYGLLKPLDAIQPYRLEMGTRVETDQGTTLYAYWGAKIARALNAQAAESGASHILNLASQEYFQAVDAKALKLPIITCHFKEMRNGQPKIISFKAKRARGLMARYLVENSVQGFDDLKAFDAEGYAFAADLSDGQDLTFLKQG